MDFDQLRSQWNNIDLPPTDGATERIYRLERKVRTSNVTTLRDKLYRITINLVIVSLFGIITTVPFASKSPVMFAVTGIFFVIMGILNFNRALSIKRIDVSKLSVREALEAVYKVERQRVICRTIGICCAVPLMIFMLLTFANVYGSWMLYGALVGALLGGCIGLAVNHRTSSLLKDMKSQLRE